MAPAHAHAYTVSGIVDFTYSSYKTRIGSVTTSDYTFSEHYEVNTGGFIYDPRFLRMTAGVGYSRNQSKASSDYSSLTYNVNASFFPGRMFSWDIYAMQNTMTVQSNASLAGYDVDTKSYGASLNLRFSNLRPRAGNNNINNNVNNSGNNNGNNNSDNNSNNNQEGRRRWSALSFPDIFLSRNHFESESKSLLNSLHETRDNTSAIILYRINSTFDMHLSGNTEEFKNLRNGSSYDTKTADLLATARVSPSAELKLNGSLNERNVNDIAGFDTPSIRNMLYGLRLNFKEYNRLSHSYTYDYSNIKTGGNENTSQSAAANVRYGYLPGLFLYGQMNYSILEYAYQATAATPYNQSSMKSGGLAAGVNYNKVYAPAFLDPFVFTANYDFGTGYSKMATLAEGDLGGGLYYQNAVSLGLVSSGWKYETVSLDSSFVSRRDHSPVNNDSMSQAYRFSVNTHRVPRTSINASMGYRLQESSSSPAAGPFTPVVAGLNQKTRSLDYTASIEHALNQNVNLSAGATQGRTNLNNGYTLSTLKSTYDTKVTQLYAQAQVNYAVTRDLRFSGSLREEKRHADYTANLTSYQAAVGANYRIRAITLSADWRLREDITDDNTPRTVQQSFIVKLSRPF